MTLSARSHLWPVLMLFLFLLATEAAADVVSVDLYVKDGVLQTVDGRDLPILGFSPDATSAATTPGPEITLAVGDQLEVTLYNLDTTPHGLEVVGKGGADSSAPPGDSAVFQFTFDEAGCWLYRDPVDLPVHQGLGLAGAVVVTDPSDPVDGDFLWLLSEHSEEWLLDHENGVPINDATYLPNYFTVNGRSGLDTLDDARATVVGRIGDSLRIRIVNGGLRTHSIHFHGYHVEVSWRDGASLSAPWSKDTVAIPVGGTVVCDLVPHQSGTFPIHDHVVQSVTANGVYPLGMIVFADIQP